MAAETFEDFKPTPTIAGGNESVNHPDHYGGKDNPYEVIKIIEHYKLGFSLGNALKYILRAGKKDPAKYAEDLKKAAWYVAREAKNINGSSQ